MSSLREKLEKKKNKYLEAARNVGKSTKKGKGDEEAQEAADSVDEPEEAGGDATKADTPLKSIKQASAATPSTPSRTDKSEKDPTKDDKAKEKEIWKYEGEYNDQGEYHGVGRLYSTSTIEFYEGQWLNGKRHGFGTQLFVTGERYQGAWKNGLMDGMGVISYPTKDSFTGQWDSGQRLTGTWHFTNGDVNVVFMEKWINGAPGPYGELIFNPGGKYVGEVSSSVVGKFTIKNYAVFRNGYGEFCYPNKDRYIGGWKKDSRKGFGIFIEASGEKYYGEWTRGKRSGYGVQIYTDGTYYEGQHLHDEMKGKGKICVPNGDSVHGEWANNKVQNAQFLKGTFDHVPRPMREIFVSNVQAIKKTEEKAPFITTEKWQAYMQKLELDPQTFSFEMVESTLLQIQAERDNEIKDYAYVIPCNVLSKAVNRFIYLFNWLYGDLALDQTKNNTYYLQTAVDDVNSFLAALTLRIATLLNLDYKANKRLYELLMQTVFHKIYNTLFPLYIDQMRVRDSVLTAKLLELKDSTTVTIGVKAKYQLTKETSKVLAIPNILTPQQPSHSNGSSPMVTPHQPSAPTGGMSTIVFNEAEEKPGALRGSSVRRHGKPLTPSAPRRNTIDDAGAPSTPLSRTEDSESLEHSPDKSTETSSPRDAIDPLTGLPQPRVIGISSTRSSRFQAVARRNSNVKGKKGRHSMNVTDLLSNKDGTEDFEHLADMIALEEVTKKKSIAEESGEGAPSSPTRVAVDPNDITAQIALEEQSRKKRNDSGTAAAEAEFLRRMGPLLKNAAVSTANTPSKRETIIRVDKDSLSTDQDSLSSSDSRHSMVPKAPVGYVLDPNDPRKELPYFQVISAVDRLSFANSPVDKLECLASAGQGILKCVDEAMTDKKEQIVMGAEDKFPILIYALIRSTAKNLSAHAQFLSDFVTEHVGDMDSKYRVSELHDALKYISSLQWNVRDKNGYLVPIKLILSNVAWAAKGLQRLKVPEGQNKNQVIADITVCVSQIFRALSDRVYSPYEPYEIPLLYLPLVKQYKSTFFDGAFGKEVGLALKESGDGLALHFELKHPLYVYSQLAQVALAPDSADLS